MNTHTEIVVVTYRRGKAGERTLYNFDNWEINRPDPGEWPEDLAFYNRNGNQVDTDDERFGGVFIDLPSDWFGLRFGFTGQFFEGQQSALSWECESETAREVFGWWADELKAIGDKLLDDEIKRRWTNFNYRLNGGEAPREVTFLTAWEYRSGVDYEGEFWSKWDLLGRIDLSRIGELSVSVKAEEVTA